MFSYWTNTVTTSEFIDAVQADNYTDVGDTLGFNGLVGRVECLLVGDASVDDELDNLTPSIAKPATVIAGFFYW